MNYNEEYSRWLTSATADADVAAELKAIENDPAKIEDAFYRNLAFGTGGLRGTIGAGTNRMNVYTVAKASQGLANYLVANSDAPSVAIGYDSRIKSDVFAKVAASVFAANGVQVNIWPELLPVPTVSFATRYLGTSAGVMITASHNPSKYNGYKVYGADGCQITTEAAAEILAEIEKLDIFADVKQSDFESGVADGQIKYISDDVLTAFVEEVKKQSLLDDSVKVDKNVAIVYSPLNGTGLKPVLRTLKETGYTNITVVKEQENPDGNFPTCPYPNPENPDAWKLALELAKEKDADIVLATDPDADRLGVYCKDTKTGEYVTFTGNMSAMLIGEYILSQKSANGTLPENPAFVESIVSTDMGKAIAAAYGVKHIEVLTGFKYIGEQMLKFEKTGCNNYVFGMEESYGCLPGTYARDKDAPAAVCMLCEVAAFYKSQGKTLWDGMIDMYEKYGYYREGISTMTLKGIDGAAQINEIMTKARAAEPKKFGDYQVLAIRDYKNDTRKDMTTGKVEPTGLPSSNVLYYELNDNAWCCVRPSGTEPKIKFYFGVKGVSLEDSQAKLDALSAEVLGQFE